MTHTRIRKIYLDSTGLESKIEVFSVVERLEDGETRYYLNASEAYVSGSILCRDIRETTGDVVRWELV